MASLHRAELSPPTAPRPEGSAADSEARLVARVDELTRELDHARRALEQERSRVDAPRGLAREVLAATTTFAIMGTVVASVAMLTAWGVFTQLPHLGRVGKDARNEASS